MGDGIHNITKRIKKINFRRIFLKTFLLLSVVILLPMGIIIWISSFTFNAFTANEIIIYSSKSISIIKNSTDDMISDSLKQMNYLAGDADINTFLISRANQEVYFFNIDRLFDQLTTQMQLKDYLESIYVYSDISNLVLSNYGLAEFEQFIDTKWYNEYKQNSKVGRFWPSFRNTYSSSGQPLKILSLYKSLGYSNNQQGILIFNINFNKFVSELSTLRSSYDFGLFIVDTEYNIVTDVWGSHDNISPGSINTLMNSSDKYIKSDEYVLYKTPIKYTGLYYISAVPIETYHSNINTLMNDMLIIIISGFAITILIAILITIRLYRPYKNILKVIRHPIPLLSESDQGFSRNEETYILNAIKTTINKNVQITQQLNERITLLKKAQSIALQSQINPHFLYNTLDTINWSAMRLTGGKNETSVMLSTLATMIRYSLESVDSLVPLAKELQHVHTYLDLQKLRYRDKFKVVWDIDEEVKKCKVIKIMLQPLLENAIHHGIRPLQSTGIISIEAKRIADNLNVIIRDNGVGMSPQEIKHINEMMSNKKTQEKEHIGIMNVNQRIHLFFGDQYGINIPSGEVRGINVILKLPYIV